MKIGVISDSHNQVDKTERALNTLLQEGIDYLIHAGDIGQDVANFLAGLPIKTIAVYGNTDIGLQNPQKNLILQKQPYYFKIGSTTFKLMHQPYFLTPDSDIVIYGHLHKFACEHAKSLFLNPGEICAREKPRIEFALIDLETKSVTYNYFENNQLFSKVACR